MCVGRRIAEKQLQIVISKLVRNFKIEWHHGEMGMTFCVLHKPNMPARFNFIERSPSERPMDP
ncbi:putative cytochrome P450 301a1, mitochondrial [Saccoglossus kowalevskii]